MTLFVLKTNHHLQHFDKSNELFFFKNLPTRLGQLVLIIAASVVAGWVFDISVLKRILPDFVVMNPTTALLFIFSAITLWLHQTNDKQGTQWMVDIISVFITVIAAIRLAGFYPRLDTGIDQLLFPNQLSGNRMAPNTALAFLLVGLSFWLLNRRRKYAYLFSQIASLLALAISLLAIIGYISVDRTLYRVATYIPMALHIAVTFFILIIGILFASSQHAVMSVIMHKNIGGKISRILLPITLLIPVIFGWLRIEAQRRGMINLEFGTALMAISIIMVFTVLIWGLAWSINRTDEKRKRRKKRC